MIVLLQPCRVCRTDPLIKTTLLLLNPRPDYSMDHPPKNYWIVTPCISNTIPACQHKDTDPDVRTILQRCVNQDTPATYRGMPKSSPWGPQPTQDGCPTMWTPGIQFSWLEPFEDWIWASLIHCLEELQVDVILAGALLSKSFLTTSVTSAPWEPTSGFLPPFFAHCCTCGLNPTSEFGAPLIILKNHEWKWKLYFPLSGPYCGARFLRCMNIYNNSDFHLNYMYLTEKRQKLSNAEGNYPHIRTYLSVEADIACGETHYYTCPVRLACGAPIHTNTCIDMHTL